MWQFFFKILGFPQRHFIEELPAIENLQTLICEKVGLFLGVHSESGTSHISDVNPNSKRAGRNDGSRVAAFSSTQNQL